MTINDITTIAILVEIDGDCHQVLASSENKKLMLTMLAQMSDGLKLSDVIEPVKFEPLKK